MKVVLLNFLFCQTNLLFSAGITCEVNSSEIKVEGRLTGFKKKNSNNGAVDATGQAIGAFRLIPFSASALLLQCVQCVQCVRAVHGMSGRKKTSGRS